VLPLNLKREATDMADGDLHDQIARLEADIEQLAETLDGCRKAMLLSKVAIAAGGIWIAAYLLGVVGFEPATIVAALAAIIGGVVVFGSNSSTSKQTTAAMTCSILGRWVRAPDDDLSRARPIGH
jgi:hypothetical protein